AVAWSREPWMYPPAYGALLNSAAGHESPPLEPSLLFAIAQCRSRFTPSKSDTDGIGLMGIRPASELGSRTSLIDPAENVRIGTGRLTRLLREFDSDVSAAISAYAGGVSVVPSNWREAVAAGGDALLCELLPNSERVKQVLATRQAYRELRPTGAGTP